MNPATAGPLDDVLPTDLRARLRGNDLLPLWESPHAHHGAGGKIDDGHIWRWSEMRPIMLAVGEVASPKVVERRTLQMLDPNARYSDGEATVGAVNATVQMLKPGEQARPHRHSMNALRFVLESTGGAKTMVDGKDCAMETGDLVLTPAWTWHTHIHEGATPVIWLDVLDVALHRYLGTEAFQPGPMTNQPPQLPEAAFQVANIVPIVEYQDRGYSPVFRYPWADAVRAIQAAPPEPDGVRRVRYANPVNGGESLSLLDTTLLQIDPGKSTGQITVQADVVFCAAQGGGQVTVGDTVRDFAEKDIFTAPANRPFCITAAQGSGAPTRLFTVSNAPMFRKLGLSGVREHV